MREGNVFSLSTQTRPGPDAGGGGRETPSSLGRGEAGNPSQVQMGGTPARSRQGGYPGYPPPGMVYHPWPGPGPDGRYPPPGMVYPPPRVQPEFRGIQMGVSPTSYGVPPWPGPGPDGGVPRVPPQSVMGSPLPRLRSRHGGYLGYPQPGMGPPGQVQRVGGVPGVPPRQGWGTSPPLGQQKEYSLRGGRYASCVHAGGLSCFSEYLRKNGKD